MSCCYYEVSGDAVEAGWECALDLSREVSSESGGGCAAGESGFEEKHCPDNVSPADKAFPAGTASFADSIFRADRAFPTGTALPADSIFRTESFFAADGAFFSKSTSFADSAFPSALLVVTGGSSPGEPAGAGPDCPDFID